MADEIFTCSICRSFSAKTFSSVLRHIGAIHSNDPLFNVVCGVNHCVQTYTNYASFRKHLKMKHPENHIEYADANEDDFTEEISSTDNTDTSLDQSQLAVNNTEFENDNTPEPSIHQAALFTLKFREIHKVSQLALTEIMTEVSTMINVKVQDIKKKVFSVMESTGVSLPTASIQSLEDKFKKACEDPFESLHTEYHQTKYYRDNLGLVEPIEIILKRKVTRQHQRSRSIIKITNHCMLYVPLLKSLQQLLQNKFIYDEVHSSHKRSDGLMGDFCDGKNYRDHVLFSLNPKALQIMLYYDDVEICNPLGSKSKIHKLGLFYYTLGNIRPCYRSTLKAIQLISIFKVQDLQEVGINDILSPFVNDLKLLEQDGGITMCINGREEQICGTLVTVSADNLASQLIGGYKSLASATRKCRFCMAVSEDMSSKFIDQDFEPRSRETHARHIQGLHGPSHNHISTTYGISCDSLLNSLKYFHVTDGLVMDIMHDVLEGALQYEVKELLKHLINNNYFTLRSINSKIKSFPYGSLDVTTKPSEIFADHLHSPDHKLRQNASQMWCLGRLLPIMLGESVQTEDQNWECFLLLLTIIDYIFAPVISEDTLPYVQQLIQEHHELFKEVYPSCNFIPKMHYMIHIPKWIEMCGPVSHLWCMRFEAKHSYFKMLANRVHNFRNISKTLANRHQHMMCYYLHYSHKSPLQKDTKYGKSIFPFFERNVLCDAVNEYYPMTVDENTSVQSVKWIEIQGSTYRPGNMVVIDSSLVPAFAKIVSILLIGSNRTCIFLCKSYSTLCLNSHFHAYEVEESEEWIAIKQTDLFDYYPLSLYNLSTHPDTSFITLKYYIHENI